MSELATWQDAVWRSRDFHKIPFFGGFFCYSFQVLNSFSFKVYQVYRKGRVTGFSILFLLGTP